MDTIHCFKSMLQILTTKRISPFCLKNHGIITIQLILFQPSKKFVKSKQKRFYVWYFGLWTRYHKSSRIICWGSNILHVRKAKAAFWDWEVNVDDAICCSILHFCSYIQCGVTESFKKLVFVQRGVWKQDQFISWKHVQICTV